MADQHHEIPSRPIKSRPRFRHLLGLSLLVGGASTAHPVAAPVLADDSAPHSGANADLSLMTYNVEGLPWPLASGRPAALQAIGERLAQMRRQGRHPTVLVLQEAFTPEAKAIGDLAGYPYQVQGPWRREPEASGAAGARWYRGETQPAALDSGLVILSDLPIVSVERAAFPASACAGYDCLAAKGVVLATVVVPGHGNVAIATTHLNSRAASGAPFERTHAAYRRQVAFLSRFLADRLPDATPLILAGDFNRGNRPARIAALTDAFGNAREGLTLAAVPSADAAWIRHRARDMQLLFDGTAMRIDATGAEIPFGTERDGSALSDHLGFTVHYRLARRGKDA